MAHEVMTALINYYAWSQGSYIALFLSLFMAVAASPIPDEIAIMTAAMAASVESLGWLPAFLITYGAVITALSLGYILGRYLGYPVMQYLPQKEKWLLRAQGLVEYYGPYCLTLSYLIPVVRHIVPYVVGMNRMPYWKYALYSYTAGLVWILMYFAIGYFCGEYIQPFSNLFDSYTWLVILLTLMGCWLFMNIKNISCRKRI